MARSSAVVAVVGRAKRVLENVHSLPPSSFAEASADKHVLDLNQMAGGFCTPLWETAPQGDRVVGGRTGLVSGLVAGEARHPAGRVAGVMGLLPSATSAPSERTAARCPGPSLQRCERVALPPATLPSPAASTFATNYLTLYRHHRSHHTSASSRSSRTPLPVGQALGMGGSVPCSVFPSRPLPPLPAVSRGTLNSPGLRAVSASPYYPRHCHCRPQVLCRQNV